MKDSDTMMPALATGVETREVLVNGVAVTYHEAGQSNTDTAPIVLVHGSSGSTLGHFGFMFPMLAVRHRVISLDLAMPVVEGEKLELDHIEAQVLAVIEASCGDTPVTLLGFSLGAVVTAFLAARHPERVANLVLLAGWAKTDTMMTFFNRTWFALRNAGVPEINDYTIYAAFGAPFLADKTVEMMTAGAMPLDAFVDAQMELNARIDISDLVPQIKAKTLVIAGTHDQMVAKHHCRQLFGMIDDARYAEVASGHAVVFERAAEVTRLVDRFNMDPDENGPGDSIPAIKP